MLDISVYKNDMYIIFLFQESMTLHIWELSQNYEKYILQMLNSNNAFKENKLFASFVSLEHLKYKKKVFVMRLWNYSQGK